MAPRECATLGGAGHELRLSWSQVREVALNASVLLEEMRLGRYPKTSARAASTSTCGSSRVVVHLRTAALALAREVERRMRGRATSKWWADGLLDLARRDEEEGVGDAPWPPSFAKRPGEPRRVQPSKARKDQR